MPKVPGAERHNLTIRTHVRRMTRLTNAFSKKWENHEAALVLSFAYYSFCRVHGTLKTTHAVMAGLTVHIWSAKELLEAVAATQSQDTTRCGLACPAAVGSPDRPTIPKTLRLVTGRTIGPGGGAVGRPPQNMDHSATHTDSKPRRASIAARTHPPIG